MPSGREEHTIFMFFFFFLYIYNYLTKIDIKLKKLIYNTSITKDVRELGKIMNM
jgi:hypothetical protein